MHLASLTSACAHTYGMSHKRYIDLQILISKVEHLQGLYVCCSISSLHLEWTLLMVVSIIVIHTCLNSKIIRMINSKQSRVTIACKRWWRHFGDLLQVAIVLCVVTLLQGETLGFSNSPASVLLPCKAQQRIPWCCAHPPDQNMASRGYHPTTRHMVQVSSNASTSPLWAVYLQQA